MKYRSAESFRSDFRRLPGDHRKLFLDATGEHFLPAIEAGSCTGTPPWPKLLRIHRLSNTEIYSLTWNFAAPDGRATCHLDKTGEGEPVLVWRRIGDHSICQRPCP
ncbi:MAG: hypothetical protein ACRDOK_29575 [Streptosporangiaceae bacterium]